MMRRKRFSFGPFPGRIMVLCMGGTWACAATTPSTEQPNSQPPPVVDETEAEQTASEPDEVATEPSSDQDSEGWADEEEANSPDAVDAALMAKELCQTICNKMDGACAARAADFCRASCGDYENAAQKCPVEVEQALTCQSEADAFLLCSNIAAPNCTPLYRRLEDCRAGTVPPQSKGQASSIQQQQIPRGFAVLTVSTLGVSQIMPQGVESKNEDGLYLSVGKDESGTPFFLRQLPDHRSAPTDKSILRAAVQLVGNDCQPKLRLRGRFESQGAIHVRFDTVCKDGTEMHGSLHFFDLHGVAVYIQQSPGQDPVDEAILDEFLYGFSRTEK